jgi:tyrosine-protein kinase Fer
MSNGEAAQKVLEGYRMNAPENCPVEVYDIMKRCWEKEPDQRPTFKELMTLINQLLPKQGITASQDVPTDSNSFYNEQ